MKIFYLPIFILLILMSCSKDTKTIKISGNVKDPMQNKAVSGAKVVLSANKISSGIYSNNYVELASANTDANGNYSFEIEQEIVNGYRFTIIKDQYFDNQVDIKTELINDKESFKKDFSIYPSATINMHIENLIPSSANDNISFRFQNADQNCSTCCNSTYINGAGSSYNQTIECKVVGNRYLVFDYTITQNGNHTYITDSVFMEVFQLKNHVIYY